MDVDAVEQRPGNLRNVTLDHGRRAVALAGGVAEIAARTRIHRGGQHEARREGHRNGGASNGDGTVFQRLAHYFEHVALKFGQLVQEQHTVVT